MTPVPRNWLLVLALALLAPLPQLGCRILEASIMSPIDSASGSVEAIGGSLSAISTSSGSPGGPTSPPAYRRDVRAFAAVFAQSGGGSTAEFQRGISSIAARHGVTHWEAVPDTVLGIGEGLRSAGASPADVERLGASLGPEGAYTAELLLHGYRGGS